MSEPLRLLLKFALSGVSVLIVAAILPGMRVRSFLDAVVFAVVVALLNAVAWQVLRVITIPASILTLGIFALVLNGIIFLVAQKVARGVEISGCFIASIAALLVALVNSGLERLLP
jgi:putative membrane protein